MFVAPLLMYYLMHTAVASTRTLLICGAAVRKSLILRIPRLAIISKRSLTIRQYSNLPRIDPYQSHFNGLQSFVALETL